MFLEKHTAFMFEVEVMRMDKQIVLEIVDGGRIARGMVIALLREREENGRRFFMLYHPQLPTFCINYKIKSCKS